MCKKIALFGAGDYGAKALKHYTPENVECFVDNDPNKWGKLILNKPVISPDEMVSRMDELNVVISSTYYEQISEQLNRIGVNKYARYFPVHTLAMDAVLNGLKTNAQDTVVLCVNNDYSAPFVKELISAATEAYFVFHYEIGVLHENNNEKSEWRTKVRVLSTENFPEGKYCFVIADEEYNVALTEKAKQLSKGTGHIINPFAFLEYYPSDVLIVNPYLTSVGDKTEDRWVADNEATPQIDKVNAYVDVVSEQVPLFRFVEIETINACNGICSFCPVNKHVDTRVRKTMPLELFHSIIEQLSSIGYNGELSLFSNNEPLLDERIVDLSRIARTRLPNARIHMFTNGTLFTIEKFKALIPLLDELIIDNYTQDLHLIKPCREIADYVEEHHELKRKVTIVLRKPHEILTSRGGDAPNRQKLVSYPHAKCALPFQQLVIRPDGKVSLCCNDPLGRNTLGDLTAESILDVWYGQKFQAVRTALSKGRAHWKHCVNCDTFYIY